MKNKYKMTKQTSNKLVLPSARNLEAVFMDLDGVIIDTEPYKFLSYMQTLTKLKVPLSILFERCFYDFYRRYCVGKSREENATRQLKWCKQNGFSLDIDWKRYVEIRKEYYELIEQRNIIPLIEKNVTLIRKLQKKNCPVYIVSRTSEDRTKAIMKRTPYENYVEIVVVPEKGMAKYSRAVESARQKGISLENCVAIEDSQEGVREAKEFKLYTIAVHNEFTALQNFSQADARTDNLVEFFLEESNR